MNTTDPKPLYRVVYDALRAEIRSGRLRIGAALPSEKQLGECFAVSRITVRRALDELGREGIIDRGAGRVSRVAEPNLVHAVPVLEDPMAMLHLVGDMDHDVLGFAWTTADATIARALQVAVDAPVLEIARLRRQGETPVLHTIAYLPQAVGNHLSRKAVEADSLHQVLAREGFVATAIERRMQAAPCPDAIAATLALKPGAPTFRNERLTCDATGRPLHLLIGYWRWDSFTLRFTADLARDDGRLMFDAEERPVTA